MYPSVTACYSRLIRTWPACNPSVARVSPGCDLGVPLVAPRCNLGVTRVTPRFDLGATQVYPGRCPVAFSWIPVRPRRNPGANVNSPPRGDLGVTRTSPACGPGGTPVPGEKTLSARSPLFFRVGPLLFSKRCTKKVTYPAVTTLTNATERCKEEVTYQVDCRVNPEACSRAQCDQRGLSTNPGLTRTGAHVRAPGVSGK